MVWKSREGKLPPPQFLAELAAYLERAYEAKPTRELMEKLYPFFVEEWRNGATSRETANATCACKKGELVPSPATAVRLAKGEVKPPRGAQRGDIFGADALRTPGARGVAGGAPRQTESPPTQKPRTKLTKKKAASPPASPPAVAVPVSLPAAMPAAPPPAVTPAAPPPAATPAAPPPAAAPATASAETQSTALLSAIQSLLPSLASQLAQEMEKDPTP